MTGPTSAPGDPGDRTDPDHPLAPMAVVGMAGRFPGAPDIDSFWRLLIGAGDAIGPVPPARWDATAELGPQRAIQDVGGFLPDVDLFDPGFFGISPREAVELDPQQRLMLETAWLALEDAGTPAAALAGRPVGVYVGASWHDYEVLRRERGATPTQHSMIGNVLDAVAARVSYFFKLTGPSLAVETGCSSSLVALHLAAQALDRGDIESALVGGVSLMLTPDNSIGLTHFGALSPTGRSRAFAVSADGFVRGEGVIALQVKRLDRAVADGDRIHGVVVRTAVNNDGGGETLVTPNPTAQEALLRTAYRGLRPEHVAYVEAHGTGTRRGDPIEAGAIGRVLGIPAGGDRREAPLAIGSVKTNIGHLEPAAGLAGLVKTLLALRYGVVPPSLHAAETNPDIDFRGLGLEVATRPWPLPVSGPLYAGVNSFGWGGTNAHAVLAPAPVPEDTPGSAPGSAPGVSAILIPLSAHHPDSLRDRARQLADRLRLPDPAGSPDARLPTPPPLQSPPSPPPGWLPAPGAGTAGSPLGLVELAGTLAHRRDHFDLRAAFVAGDRAEAAAALTAYADDPGSEMPGLVTGRARPHRRTVLVFSGQGSQWAGLGTRLYAEDPVFAETVRRCSRALSRVVDWDPEAVIAGRAGSGWLDRLEQVQPVLWAIAVSLAETWRAHGVEPDVVLGHSQGEVAAATVAGILDLDDAALVIATRSRLVARTAGRGGMLAVELDATEVEDRLVDRPDLALAVTNGLSSSVVSGAVAALRELRAELEADGVFCRPVAVDYAAHSAQMDELADELRRALTPIRPRAGRVPLMSTVDVRMLKGTDLGPDYWIRNLRRTVKFAPAMATLLADGASHVIEISGHPLLLPVIEELAAETDEPARVLVTLHRDQDSAHHLTLALAAAYTAGLHPFLGLPPASADLPAYPWQRSRFWVAAGRRRSEVTGLGCELLPEPGCEDRWSGTMSLALADHPWLGDHRVHGAVVVPAVAVLALGLGAARSRLGELPVVVEELVLSGDLTLDPDAAAPPVTVHISWSDDVTAGGTLTVRSLRPGEGSWTEHLTARMSLKPPADGPSGFPRHLLDDGEPVDVGEVYATWHRRGLEYGPAFRTLAGLWTARGLGSRQPTEALARIDGPGRAAEVFTAPVVPAPVLWDGALQTVLALTGQAGAMVPTGFERVVRHADRPSGTGTIWSHAVRREDDRFDLHLFDAEQRPLMTMAGVTLRAVVTAPLEPQSRFLRLRFVPSPPAHPLAPVGPEAVGWEVHGDAESTERVTALLVAAGLAAVAVPTSGGGSGDRGGPGAGSGRDPGSDPTPPVLVYVAPRDDLAAQRRGLLDLARLVSTAVTADPVPRLVVLTERAQTPGGPGAVDPGAALFWGFARVVGREHPELDVRLVDVGPHDWDLVAAELRAAGTAVAAVVTGEEQTGGETTGTAGSDGDRTATTSEDQVLLHEGRRHVGRLERSTDPAGDENDSPRPPWRGPRQPFRVSTDRPGYLDRVGHRPAVRVPPGPGQIEIEVSAAGVNFIDVVKAMGTYPDPVDADRFGNECAGTVVAVGAGVDRPAPGDRVVVATAGAMTSHVTVPADITRPVPAGLTDEMAAGLPVVQLTAWYGLHDLARLEAGETVLIHSGAGGLGLAAIGVARALGARIVATAGTAAKRAYLRESGIESVLDSRDRSWPAGVLAATGGRGVDVVLNSLTGAAIQQGLEVLAEDGRFVEVGKTDIYAGRTLDLAAFRKRIAFFAVDLAGLARNRPERLTRLLDDVLAEFAQGRLHPVRTTTYPFAEVSDALRAMSTGNHIGKFVLTDPASVTAVRPQPLPLRPDATYVITGGTGALGLCLAEFLVERGATRIALMARAQPLPPVTARLAALTTRGVTVSVVPGDVRDQVSVASALAEVRRHGPIRGVVHAAGVLRDATVARISATDLEEVLAPKVDGALNLDRATMDDPLDFFVLFSSMAGLVGNAGQAGYAAANAYLDALAVDRRHRGLPALSVQWGPFTEVGLATADELRGARLGERGLAGFAPQEAWTDLFRMLSGDEQVIGYGPLDLSRWFDSFPETAGRGSWEWLRRESLPGTGDGPRADGDLIHRLRTMDPERRVEAVRGTIRDLAGKVLGLDADAVDPETGFRALGLDSLMSLELRNRLQSTLGLSLSPTILWTYRTPRALAQELSGQLEG